MKIINHYIIVVTGEKYISYKRGSLYVSSDLTKFEFLCKVPMSVIRRLLCQFSLTSRLLRLFPRAVRLIDESSFIFGYYGSIFNVNIVRRTIIREHVFPSPMKAPLSFTKVENVRGFDDCILYGEYHANPEKRDMWVYARKKGEWKQMCSFPSTDILHIHGFCVDKQRDRVLILTGDKDEESRIYEAKNNFKKVSVIVKGEQVYRSCVAFADSSVIYATDTPLTNNYICKLNEDNSFERIYEMPGPSIFGKKLVCNVGTQYVFATSVEPDSRIRGWRYMLNWNPGPGIKGRCCHIVCGNEEIGFKTVLKLEKDCLPMAAFQFGNASFVESKEDQIFVLPQSVKKYNGKTIIIKA